MLRAKVAPILAAADRGRREAAPNPGPRFAQGGGRAFTLLEILLVLALMALLAGIFSVGFSHMLDQSRATAPDEVFWEAAHAAQELATLSEHEVTLRFDGKAKQFVATNGAKTDTHALAETGDVSVQFLQVQKGGSSVLIGGQLIETQEIPAVTFYPDGTCTPFRVQFRLPAGPLVLTIDPWTCAPMLEKPTS